MVLDVLHFSVLFFWRGCAPLMFFSNATDTTITLMRGKGWRRIWMNKVVLYNVIGMLIVTYIDDYYRSTSMYLCVLYKNKERGSTFWMEKKSIAKENYCVSTLPNVYFLCYLWLFPVFLVMYFMHTEAKIFNSYYSSVPILKNSLRLKQGLQKRD